MKVHIAIAVKDLEESVREYQQYLKSDPVLVIEQEYALWRTDVLNLSLRRTDEAPGTIRHVGFEDDAFKQFESFIDSNGVLWEQFNKSTQADEIKNVWQDVDYHP